MPVCRVPNTDRVMPWQLGWSKSGLSRFCCHSLLATMFPPEIFSKFQNWQMTKDRHLLMQWSCMRRVCGWLVGQKTGSLNLRSFVLKYGNRTWTAHFLISRAVKAWHDQCSALGTPASWITKHRDSSQRRRSVWKGRSPQRLSFCDI